MQKNFIITCFVTMFTTFTASAQGPKPKLYENWPSNDQEWTALTNHIMWCYNSLRDRECVATGRTNNFVGAGSNTFKWEPSLVCPFRDYSLIAQNIDRLAPYFVNHTLAGSNGDFSNYFTTTNAIGTCPTEFPHWTPESLHSNAFGRSDWSTNSVLTVWMAVTNRTFIAEVTAAIEKLKWTSVHGVYSGLGYDQTCTEMSAQIGTNADIEVACDVLLPKYAASKRTYLFPSFTNLRVSNYYDDFWPQQNVSIYCTYTYKIRFAIGNDYNRNDFDSTFGRTPEKNPFTYQPNVSAYVRREIEWSGYTPSMAVLGRTKVLLAQDLGVIHEGDTPATDQNPIATFYSMLNDPMSYAELADQSYDQYPGADYWESDLTPIWLLKWNFGEPFSQSALPSFAPIQTPDTDVDGVVQTMPVDALPGSETGTFSVNTYDESPTLYLPLSTEATWDGTLPVHAYLSQGAVTNLPYHFVPWWPSRGSFAPCEPLGSDIPLLALNTCHYSLNTCILDFNVITNAQTHLKQAAVLRPRGEVVIFDFPWDGAAFSKKGFPTGVNRELDYVMYFEKSAIYDNELEGTLALVFPSGIGHAFASGPWRAGLYNSLFSVFSEDGVTRHDAAQIGVPLYCQFNLYRSWTQEVATVTGGIYRVTVEWKKGAPTCVTYRSVKTAAVCESVTLNYRDGRVVWLDKGDSEAEARIQADNSVLYGTGIKQVREQAGTRMAGRTAKVTTFDNEGATTPYLTETCIYDNHQRLSNRTLVAGSQSASYGYTYKNESATDERYLETGLLVRNSVDKHTKTGSFGSFDIIYQYTTQQGWPTSIKYSMGGGSNKETLLDYYPESSNPEDYCLMKIPLKGRRLKSREQRQDNLSITKTLHANKTSDSFYYLRNETETCYAPNATWGDVNNHRYCAETDIHNDGYYSLATGFRMYQYHTKMPASEAYCYNYSNTCTEAFFDIVSDSTYKDITVNARGVPTYSRTMTKEGATLDESVTFVDGRGRPECSTFMDGTSVHYMNYCVYGPRTIFNRDDSITTIEYDPFGRVKKRVDGETGITYAYEYDPNGNVLKQTCTAGTLKAESFASYGLDGEMLYSKDEAGHEVTVTGQNSNGFLVLTRTETGHAPVTETYWADGVLKSVTGIGAPARFNRERGVTNNKYWVKTVNPDNPSEWSTQWHHYNGLYAYIEQPGGVTNAVAYDEKLRPKADVSADKVKSIASYDAKYPGLSSVSGVSLSGNDQISLASDPYCVSNSYAFTSQGLKTTQYSYPEDNSATPFEEGYTQVSPDGRTGTFSVQGRIGTFSCDAPPSTGSYKKTVNLPGGGIATSTYSKFLLREETMQEAGTLRKVTKTYQYDKFNRLETSTTDERGFKETVKVVRDPTKGLVSNINSSSRGSISITRENDLVKQIAAPSGTTTFGWKGNGGIDSVQQDLGPKFSREEDAFGRDKSITRQKEGLSSVLDFSYGNDGGFAGKKRDNVQKISVTSRRADGRPKVTVLPDGITVTTDFDGAGRESGQTWTDPTNASATVAFTHSWMRDGTLRRQGQVGGPFVSNSLNRATGRITSSTSSFGCGASVAAVQTAYDVTHGAPSLITAQFNGFTNMNLSATAAHDTFGYLFALSGDEFTNVFSCATGGMITNTMASIGANLQLRRSVIWSAQAGKPVRVDYTLNGQFLRRWQYTFTNGLIASVSRSGGDGYRTAYAYDGAKQLIGATSTTTNGLALPALSFAYEYTLAGDTFKYGRASLPNTTLETSDDLQTMRIWQPYVHLLGRVSALNATVTSYTSYKTNRFPATVTGGLYYSTPVIDMLSQTIPTSGVATVIATLPSGTAETARVAFSLPASYETPTYNGRGMILSDSRRQYTWDAAERLTSISNSGVSNAVKLSFQYYPDGRRAQKTVSCFTNNAWVATRSLQYAWQGWKLAGECERNGEGAITAVRHFVWGPDIAGQQSASLESGAEGVGGLLLIREWKPDRGMKQYLPLTDGLGNICGLLDASDGSLVAEFDYDPYGNPVIESLTHSRTNELTNFSTCPFRHRTRYYDSESWLYYYGYRYYDPSTTKWISKDPLAEAGGWNLTCFCSNDPVNGLDPLGLALYAFDGTGNDKDEFDDLGKPRQGVDPLSAPSHVAALFWMYSGRKYYENGVGTRTDKVLGNVGGKGAKERLGDMLTKFEATYQNGKGDTDIEIIGFSRGAAMAREFANMIYDKYPKAKIRFLGLFDTVAQVGLPNDANVNPGIRLEIPYNVQFVAHAVAKEEYRELFPLTSIVKRYGGIGLGFGYTGIGLDPKRYLPKDYDEVKARKYWEKPFDGAHSDVGGGYADGTNLKALKWMYSTALEHGVNLDWKSMEFEQRKSVYKQGLKAHDSRWKNDKIPFTGVGRYSRTIFSGNLTLD